MAVFSSNHPKISIRALPRFPNTVPEGGNPLAGSYATISVKAIPRFPSAITADQGLALTFNGTAYNFSLAYPELAENTGITEPQNYTIATYNTVTGEYERVKLTDIPLKAADTVRNAIGDESYAILSTDAYLALTAPLTASRVWTLPPASEVSGGNRFRVQDEIGGIGSTFTLTIQTQGNDRIDGQTTLVLNHAYAGIELISDGVSKYSYRVIKISASEITTGTLGIAQGGTGLSALGSGVQSALTHDVNTPSGFPLLGANGALPINKGGTAALTASDARANLGLATVAASGSYNDLTNKPSLFSGSYTDLTNKPTLGTVAALDIVPVSMGGTNATDAAGARTNLGLSALAITVPGTGVATGLGNAANGASGIIVLDSSGKIPALDGSNLTNVKTPPGGTTGQVQFNAGSNTFGGFTVSGDGSLDTSTGILTVTKSNGNLLGALATLTPGTGVATALAISIGAAGSFVANGGALGTPSSGTLTNCTFPTLNQNTTGTAAGLSTTLVASSGGTGQSSYAIGDILYASGTTALSKLSGVATGNTLISGGAGTAPSWGKVGLTTHVSGTLPVSNGGTGLTSLTAGYIPYGNGTGAFSANSGLSYSNNNLILGSGQSLAGLRYFDISNLDTTSSSGSIIRFITQNVAGTGNVAVNIIKYKNGSFVISNTETDSAANIAFQVGASERMRITSGGLVGIGSSSPNTTLTVQSAATNAGIYVTDGIVGTIIYNSNSLYASIGTVTNHSVSFWTNNSLKMLLDTSGNLGLGVTPSAWNTYKAFEVGALGSALAGTSGQTILTNNARYFSNWVYANNGYASFALQINGEHRFYNAPSGTAGSAISFTQALTLTAAANLLLGGTSDPGGANSVYIANTSSVPGTPSSGGVLYVQSGALKYKGSGGTITTLGAA